MSIDDLDGVFAALADPMRRQLLDELVGRGEASASALAAVVPVSRQAVLKHLNVLDDAGLVTARRSGREVLYRARPERLQATAARMSELAARWDERLDQIKRIAES